VLNLILVGVVLILLALGFYLGWKIKALKADVEARGEYIKKTNAVLSSFMSCSDRIEDLHDLIDKIKSSEDSELTGIYNGIISKKQEE
jgi:hypothetical protein